jgi:site-specific recombinase XerD
MPKRSQFVAKNPADKTTAKRLPRIPANLDEVNRPASGQRWWQDSKVTALRLRASRLRLTWIYYGRLAGGQPVRERLGWYPQMDLDQARQAAIRRAAAAGHSTGSPTTFADLRTSYFDSIKFQGLAARTQKSYKWVLQNADYAPWNKRKVRDITRRDVLALMDTVHKSGRAHQNIMRPLMALMTWAVKQEYIDASPATKLELPANMADAKPYTDQELGQMLTAAKEAPEPWATLYQLVAYTGQRPSTWSDAKWAEVDPKHATLTISRTRARSTKKKAGWSVPLNSYCLALLKALQKAQGRRRNDWLFGQPLVAESKIRNRIAKAAKLHKASNRGTMHRFRSTMLTKLNEWRVPSETQQRMAGHANPFDGARGHYIPAPPTPEMVEVAERYGEWVNYCALL